MSDDTVSRQAAIEAIEEMQIPIMRSIFPEEQFVFKGMSEALSAIKDLPSAQPEHDCSTCRYSGLEWDEEPCDSCTAGGENNHWKLSAQPKIIRCKDCKYNDENWRRVSVKWLPCMDIRVPSNWFCGSAERRTDGVDNVPM